MKLALAGLGRHRLVVTQPLDDAEIDRLDRFFEVAICAQAMSRAAKRASTVAAWAGGTLSTKP